MGASKSMEPDVAQRYAFSYDPIQRYLNSATGLCGGWGNWCCVCNTTKDSIRAIHDDAEYKKVSFFLNSTCCKKEPRSQNESRWQKEILTLGPRSYSVMWTPDGWRRLDLSRPGSDSFSWSPTWDSTPLPDFVPAAAVADAVASTALERAAEAEALEEAEGMQGVLPPWKTGWGGAPVILGLVMLSCLACLAAPPNAWRSVTGPTGLVGSYGSRERRDTELSHNLLSGGVQLPS
jgi:hypothetical protein